MPRPIPIRRSAGAPRDLPAPVARRAPLLRKLPASVRELFADATESIGLGVSDRTLRAYREWWVRWCDWSTGHGMRTLPVEAPALVAWLQSLRGSYAPASLRQAVAAVSKAQSRRGGPAVRSEPLVRDMLRDLAVKSDAVPRHARALTVSELARMVAAVRPTACGVRDAALLLVGYVTALRESELVALDREDLTQEGAEWLVRIRRTKTRQSGEPDEAGIPRLADMAMCPASALTDYIERDGVWHGPLWRTSRRGGYLTDRRLDVRDVDRIIQRAARLARVDPAGLSGHSLRRGLMSAAAAAGVALQDIARAARQRSLGSTLRYVDHARILRDHVARRIGMG